MNIQGINNYSSSSNYLNNKTYSLRQDEPTIVNKPGQVSFGAKETKLGKWISEFFGKHYAKPMNNKMWIHNFAEKTKKIPGKMTEHLVTLGSVLTSGVYVYRTLNNKNLEHDNRKTLAVNQTLCCIIPAIMAYTVSKRLEKVNKKVEYRYRGLKDQQVALKQIDGKKAEQLKKTMGTKLKGLGTLTSLLTFTLIYRYLTPVVVTPIANAISNKRRERKEARMLAEQQQAEAVKQTVAQPEFSIKIDEQADDLKNEKLSA